MLGSKSRTGSSCQISFASRLELGGAVVSGGDGGSLLAQYALGLIDCAPLTQQRRGDQGGGGVRTRGSDDRHGVPIIDSSQLSHCEGAQHQQQQWPSCHSIIVTPLPVPPPAPPLDS